MISTHPSRVMTWWWRQRERDTVLYWPEEQKSITSQLCPLLFFPQTYDKHTHACGHKIAPTVAYRHSKHTAVKCSTFSILFLKAIPQKKACGVPPASSTCVCVCVGERARARVCQGTDAALSCGHDANEHWRCWDLEAAAQLNQADDPLAPQRLHLSCHDTLQLPAHTQKYTRQVSWHVRVCS